MYYMGWLMLKEWSRCHDVEASSRVEKIGERGGQNMHVQCVCTQRQLIVHMQKKREKKGWKGGIEARVKSKREER